MSNTQRNVSIFSIAILITFLLMYLMFLPIGGSVIGLLAGGFMAGLTLILGLISYAIGYYRQKSAFQNKQKSVDDMSVKQTRTIEIDLPFHIAFDLAQSALATLDGESMQQTTTGIPTKQVLKIHEADSDIGRIRAGIRANTFGVKDPFDMSKIDIQLQRLDNNTTRVQIISQPSSPLETFDLGRHTHFVNQLALTMRQKSAEQSLSDSDHHELQNHDANSEQKRRYS